MSEKPRLAFIDHSFHQKTKSSDFFVELLQQRFEVMRIWDEGWQGGSSTTAETINAQRPDAIVFWQAMIPDRELGKLRAPATWVPMFDQSQGLAFGSAAATAVRMSGLKAIAFCQGIGKNLARQGVDVLGLQYFPAPETAAPMSFQAPRVFLWQRADIGFDHLKTLFQNWSDCSFVVKIDPDPEFPPTIVTPEEMKQFNVEVIHGFLEKDVYQALVGTCNVYVAPRTAEGIGLSFLEAMAKGMIVVAPDRPTMSEYVIHGETGFLFNAKRPTPLPWPDLDAIGSRSLESVRQGHVRWKGDSQRVADFILAPASYSFQGVSPILKARIFTEKVQRKLSQR